jgi:hypothetical protein
MNKSNHPKLSQRTIQTFRFSALLLLSVSTAVSVQGAVVDFEDLTVFNGTSGNMDNQPGGRFYNGNTGTTNSDGFSSGGMYFSNSFTQGNGFNFWSGFAYSNVVNSVSSGFTNQYASVAGGGADGSGGFSAGTNYGLLFGGGYLNLPVGRQLSSMEITNTTYAHNSMRDGDGFAKKFGGASGADPDFLRLNIVGFDEEAGAGSAIGNLQVALADYTFADSAMDYILNSWTSVDLSSLSAARSLTFSFESSDVGAFGINTPTYFAVDNIALTAVPEPASAMPILLALCATLARRRKS